MQTQIVHHSVRVLCVAFRMFCLGSHLPYLQIHAVISRRSAQFPFLPLIDFVKRINAACVENELHALFTRTLLLVLIKRRTILT